MNTMTTTISDNEINRVLETIRPIMNATRDIMNPMIDGERMPIKEMTIAVGKLVNMQPVSVLPFVNYLAHNTTVGYTSRGKFGGFVKGQKKLQMVDVSETTTSTDNTDTDNTETTNTDNN